MNKIIRLSDAIVTPDRLKCKFNDNCHGLDTDIIITAHNGHHDGELSVKHFKNKTVLNGRSQLLELPFGVTPNMAQHIFINDNVLGEYNPETGLDYTTGITQAYNSPASILPRNNMNLWRRRKIEYWCAGDGAINRSIPNQSYEAHITDIKVIILKRLIILNHLILQQELIWWLISSLILQNGLILLQTLKMDHM